MDEQLNGNAITITSSQLKNNIQKQDLIQNLTNDTSPKLNKSEMSATASSSTEVLCSTPQPGYFQQGASTQIIYQNGNSQYGKNNNSNNQTVVVPVSSKLNGSSKKTDVNIHPFINIFSN